MKTLFALILSLVFFNASPQTIKEVTAVEAQKFLESKEGGNYVIIDGRDSAMFFSGHIKDAVNINAYKDYASDSLSNYLDEDHIFLYCTTRNRSDTIIKKFKKLGYNGNIVFMKDGVVSWKENEFKLEK
jgi:rhodanese-related sulfurtransferase